MGGKARVGPVGTGLSIAADIGGLSGGCWHGGKMERGGMDAHPVIIGFERGVSDRIAQRRLKNHDAFLFMGISNGFEFPITDTRRFYSLHYLTQIEVAAALGIRLRIGFNPGELIDLILGFFTLDPYGDDLRSLQPGY